MEANEWQVGLVSELLLATLNTNVSIPHEIPFESAG